MIVLSDDMKTFFFLYEGSTDWSDQGLLMGQQDIVLNDKGRLEAEEAGKILVGHEIASLCFSPLARAKETAQIVAKHCHCGLYSIEGLKERHWGSLEGQAYQKDQFDAAGEKLPEGIEEKTDFTERVRSALILAAAYPSPTLIVSHTGVLHIICADLNVGYPAGYRGVIHFFQRLGQWVAKPLELPSSR